MLLPLPSGPENSLAFMPNTELMKDRGRKMIVIIVNSMIERPWVTPSSARLSAYLASMILACCCLRSSKDLSYDCLAISFRVI